MAKFKRKLVWTQETEPYVRAFYTSWVAAGVPVIALAYGADALPSLPDPTSSPGLDIIFVGNLWHRKRGNVDLFRRLFALTKPERISVYGDAAWRQVFGISASPTPPGFDLGAAYRSAALAPNVHTMRQREHLHQLNDRAFQIAGFGGCQICDNPLIKEAFAQDEVPFAATTDEFIDIARELLRNPQRRADIGRRAHARALRDHHWLNRLAVIFRALGIDREVKVDGRTFAPVACADGIDVQIGFDRWLYYTVEAHSVRLARNLKRLAFGPRQSD